MEFLDVRVPRFLIAKYVPDLGRMEPRNIGVVVWTPEAVDARFAAEMAGRPGIVDGRSIPSFVTSPAAYRQWIAFWRAELSRTVIEPIEGGDRVARGSPGFLDVLAGSGRGNFLLADGGFLLDAVGPDELPSLVDSLFGMLVETSGPEEPRDLTLDEACEKLIEEAGLVNDPHFKPGHSVACLLPKGTEESFEFSYYYGNVVPRALYQRLPLSGQRRRLKKDLNDAAWKFSKVIEAGIVPEERSGVLVMPSPEQREDPKVKHALDVIGSVTRVLDMANFDAVRAEFSHLPSLVGL